MFMGVNVVPFFIVIVNLQVVEYVRAIRKGLIKFDKPKEEPRFYLLWGDDSSSADRTKHLAYIPPPKPKLPGLALGHLN